MVVGQVQSWLYTEARVVARTWPNIKKVTTVTVQDGLLECGMLCSSTEDCALFHLSDGSLCVLAKVAELVILSNVRFIHHRHSRILKTIKTPNHPILRLKEPLNLKNGLVH